MNAHDRQLSGQAMVNSAYDAQRMHALFAGSDRAHGEHAPPRTGVTPGVKVEIKETAKTVSGPASEEHWRKHLEGTYAVGVT